MYHIRLARILLRTAEHLSADTMKLNWTHKHNEQFDVSVEHKLMMLYCAQMTGLNNIYKVYISLHIYSRSTESSVGYPVPESFASL